MSIYLWTALGIAIVAGVAVIVIALVAQIENDNRRYAVSITIALVALATAIVCSTLIRIHQSSDTPDVALPVETEPISGGLSPN